MQYILLIYHNEEQVAAMSEKDMAAIYKGYGTFTKGIVKSGHFKAGDPLQPVATAMAAKIPTAKHGSIEVRPIMPMGDM